MIPTLVLPEHVHDHKVRLEFLAELALAILPELARVISPKLAPSLVLAQSLALPDLVCAIDGGHPPPLQLDTVLPRLPNTSVTLNVEVKLFTAT